MGSDPTTRGRASHVGFSDESYWSRGRYRSLALVTAARPDAVRLHRSLEAVRRELDLEELKWSGLRSAKTREAAFQVLGIAVAAASSGRLRMDTLIWDTEDSRHSVDRRDDVANLGRMYYHLLKNVLDYRWPKGATWALYPDERDDLDWEKNAAFLKSAAHSQGFGRRPWSQKSFVGRVERSFRIVKIEMARSERFALVQLADLFAGLGAYSHESSTKYRSWLERSSGQENPLDASRAVLTRADKKRLPVIDRLLSSCRESGLEVRISSRKGLWTPNPRTPVNFWLCRAQSGEDLGPTKGA